MQLWSGETTPAVVHPAAVANTAGVVFVCRHCRRSVIASEHSFAHMPFVAAAAAAGAEAAAAGSGSSSNPPVPGYCICSSNSSANSSSRTAAMGPVQGSALCPRVAAAAACRQLGCPAICLLLGCANNRPAVGQQHHGRRIDQAPPCRMLQCVHGFCNGGKHARGQEWHCSCACRPVAMYRTLGHCFRSTGPK